VYSAVSIEPPACERAARVLLQVCALDFDRPALAVDGELDLAAVTDRRVVLGDLEVLRQIGVVVVLPVKPGLLGDLRAERLADLDGRFDGPLVEHR